MSAAGQHWTAPLRVPAFRYQFLAQATSIFGSMLSPVALSLGVLSLTRSAHDYSLVLVASSVPTVLFLLVGGVWADRLPRHKVMVVTNLVSAAAQAAIGIMLVTGAFHLWIAVLAQACTGTALAFYFPSVNGLTAQVVPDELLQPANALLSLVRSIAGSLGPLVASVLAVSGDAGVALLIDAFTFLVGGWLLSRIDVRPAPRTDRTSFVADLAAGFREVITRPWVWSTILGFMVGQLAQAVFLVVGPLLLLQRAGGALIWGVTVAAMSVGQIVGDALALRVRPRRPLVFCRLVDLLGAPVLFVLAVRAPSWVVIVAAVPAGIAVTLPDSLWFTVLQRQLAPDALSRVSSYDWLGSLSLRPIGYFSGGFLATVVGAAPLLLGAGTLYLATKLLTLLPADVRTITLSSERVDSTAVPE
ncbi:MFS transporter [Actinoplanes subtropicus]|uniref:MFS transporter n=1 Tax=Actinoplanes subtropicus TaxID=543632 RepID=UPI0004C2BFA5|nr:MFS transporter [Actinoplanes subtropicus]